MESEADAEKLVRLSSILKSSFKLNQRCINVAHYRPPKKYDGKHSVNKAADLDSKQNAEANIVKTQTKQVGVECDLTIDDLPNDMLFNIFARLPLENLYALEKGSYIYI